MQVNARSTFAGRPIGDALPVTNDWRSQALCAQVDPELFFPEKGGSAEPARRVCLRCPVTRECLEFALEHDERFGVWGGLSEQERRDLARARQEAADPGERSPGLTSRGNGRWAITVAYRRPDGVRGHLCTTVTGDRDTALRRLAEVRARAAALSAGQVEADPAEAVV